MLWQKLDNLVIETVFLQTIGHSRHRFLPQKRIFSDYFNISVNFSLPKANSLKSYYIILKQKKV